MPVDFQPEIDFEEDTFDASMGKAAKKLGMVGQAFTKSVGDTAQAVDRFTGAPVRAAIGAYQEDKPVGEAFLNQFMKPAETAPSGKDIAAKAGVSTEEFDTPFISNPFTGEHYKASPAGIVGGLGEAVTDPTTYVPGAVAFKGVKVGAKTAGGVAPKVADYLAKVAEERAVKAGTGQNARAMRKLMKTEGKSAGDIGRAEANLRKSGRHLLEDTEGGPTVGFFSKSEDVGEKAALKRKMLGQQIGDVGETVDKITPNSIVGADLAKEIRDYAESIPNVGKGATLKSRLMSEADNFEGLGPMTFKQAQDIKGQFPYTPQAADVLISDKDVTNKIHGIIGKKMDDAVKKASTGAEYEKLFGGAKATDADDQLKSLSKYGPAKEQYGTFKNIADAGTEASMRALSNRAVSPSDYAAGSVGLLSSGPPGILMGLANKLGRERGSAFAARSADALSKKIMAAPAKYGKWLPVLQKGAAASPAGLVTTHHLLMNNDPEYRAIFEEANP